MITSLSAMRDENARLRLRIEELTSYYDGLKNPEYLILCSRSEGFIYEDAHHILVDRGGYRAVEEAVANMGAKGHNHFVVFQRVFRHDIV